MKLAFTRLVAHDIELAGPRPGPGGTFGLVTKLNCLSIVTSGNPQMYASVAMPSGVFEVESCAILILRSSVVGCAVVSCNCAWALGKYCIALNEPEKHSPAKNRIIAVLIFRGLVTIKGMK